jgi:hypothetical protein
MKVKFPFFIVGIVCVFVQSARAGNPLEPHRLRSAPKIDGLLDDSAWISAPRVTGFETFAPDYGKRVEEQTTVLMGYDDENIYFGVRCFDPSPEKIKTSVTSRDNMLSDDWFCLNLDSFNDRQGLYAFYINPAGIQADSRSSAGREDFSLDYVWYSAGVMDSAGYTLEIQVPLKSIRYSDGDTAMMAVIFERYISRRSEHSSYPALDPAKGLTSFVTQMMPIAYPGVRHYTLFELLPAFTMSQQFSRAGPELVKDRQEGTLSLTGKYGITSNLILDATINPDFSQVESDAGQIDVNLRFALFNTEKRPFFLEGRDNFAVAATQISSYRNIDPVIEIFHSRTIVDPIAGAKLTGKTGAHGTIASLYAMDELPEEDRALNGHFAHFPVVRYKHALSDDSYVGGLFAGDEREQSTNNVAGLDGQIRLSPAGLIESGAFLSQFTETGPAAEIGHTVGVRYAYDDRDLGHTWTFREISKNFRADMGYITRTGIIAVSGSVRPKIYPSSALVQRLSPELYSAQTFDEFSELWETYNHASLSALFRGNLSVTARWIYATEIFEGERFQTGGYLFSFSGQATQMFSASLAYQNSRAVYYDSLAQGRSQNINGTILFQPSEKFQAEGSFVYSKFERESDGKSMYDYPIGRVKLTYQLNRYLFFRGIAEYNDYHKELTTDFLASFTYIPGTVIFLGYGSLYDKTEWDGAGFVASSRFLEMQRGFFFKTSYLWRV